MLNVTCLVFSKRYSRFSLGQHPPHCVRLSEELSSQTSRRPTSAQKITNFIVSCRPCSLAWSNNVEWVGPSWGTGKAEDEPEHKCRRSVDGDEAMWAVVLTKELYKKGVWCVSSARCQIAAIDKCTGMTQSVSPSSHWGVSILSPRSRVRLCTSSLVVTKDPRITITRATTT